MIISLALASAFSLGFGAGRVRHISNLVAGVKAFITKVVGFFKKS